MKLKWAGVICIFANIMSHHYFDNIVVKHSRERTFSSSKMRALFVLLSDLLPAAGECAFLLARTYEKHLQSASVSHRSSACALVLTGAFARTRVRLQASASAKSGDGAALAGEEALQRLHRQVTARVRARDARARARARACARVRASASASA
eukprot:2128205-Pleurochrysis_carterae.AAC.1